MAKPVVVGVDGSSTALRAVRWAMEEARRRGAALRIVHAVEPPALRFTGGFAESAGIVTKLRAEGERVVAEAAEVAGALPRVTTVIPAAAAPNALLAESATAQLVVLGATGHHAFPALLVGAVPAVVVAHAHCAVAVVRGVEQAASAPVVMGIDGGPYSTAVIAAAFEEAARRDVRLIAVHSWSDADLERFAGPARPYFGWEPVAEAERRLLAENLVGWQEKYPDVAVDRVAVRDRPRHLLLEWSKKAQLVVVGKRGRGGFAGLLLGSTSQALISHAHSPVLVVHRLR
ncbi:universal stress protein [Amycolatopsis sp. K13G38]|uniref:Universal stress protein n=1 Tax=Amycolatopsis acididurans TaxID=2724524 RepID=A0ABX1J6E5_9PSEU|nr:universal stress protein [Amycolatopsis acididurans]NKQ53920.1 universal stress protein [Amycolatopsis acididurans]